MLESALLVVDKLIALVRVHEENKKNFFKDFVEPLYAEVEKAYQDRYQFLMHLKRLTTSSDPKSFSEETLRQVHMERDMSRSLRLKIRTLSEEYKARMKTTDRIHDFFSMAGELFGPVSDDLKTWKEFDETRITDGTTATTAALRAYEALAREYERTAKQHERISKLTMTKEAKLELLHKLTGESEQAAKLGVRRAIYMQLLDRLTFDSEKKWKHITKSYGALQASHLTHR